ncbi:SDR family NAD(P)-dependent oxidoreductase [Ruegeria marina]|uniref:NAD(P)-dependent dehydrogenase, short-chain alcohol dehydrogenase family n=1 Tax=Ruegeria marina TaxID=639004 RepID=A0A1G6IAP2_9RHOB|nr:glucose 1-dehydrogenase [Ruegeria marina]SDC03500.1 NAD(P)-dependent dehydrogenase, short-chain alcohol dehydrogenase family [Ruegeria marina]
MKRLDGRTCIVTGGAHRIGKATCLRLAEEGARVTITDIEDYDGQSLCEDIVGHGGTAEYWHLDVTDEDAVETVFGEVADRFGGVDVVVNNAGIFGADKPTDEVTSEEWRKVMDVNVNGVFCCTKAATPHMRQNGGGSIVNLSSIYGIVGAPDIPPYDASKGAVREMSKTDTVLYAKEGIRVNSINVGFIWTPLVEAMAEASEDGPETFLAHLDELHPVGHVGVPEDIAAGIAYLASGDVKFVVGSELL